MPLDPDACYTAVRTRDPRFDGWFYTGVTSTGIYCRPSCPARTPLRRNARFFPTAAAAQVAGFRACRRCRPDTVPGSPEYDHAADVAGRAVRLIDDGYVERHGVDGLAGRLGYSSRHLQRILTTELGAGPLHLARARRAHAGRVLVQTTDLSFADIAFAAGFGSVRQFNDTVREVFAVTPSELRAAATGTRDVAPPSSTCAETGIGTGVRVRLPYREPFDAVSLWRYLRARIVPGLEEMAGGTYRRAIALPGGPGIVELTPADGWVDAVITLPRLHDLGAAVTRCRRLLDLDADSIGRAHGFDDDPLGTLAARYPGLRVPGSTEPFETAVRTVLGQQVSLAAAARLGAVLVERAGTRVDDSGGGLVAAFPEPAQVLDAMPLPMPGARNRTVAALAEAVADGTLVLDHAASFAATADALDALPGIGPWTRDYIRMRALGDPDAFPAGDLALRRQAEHLGLPGTTTELSRYARRWSPFGSFAAQLLWTDYLHDLDQRTPARTSPPTPPTDLESLDSLEVPA